MSSDILTVEEVTEYLRLTKKTVYKMVVEKQITAFGVWGFWCFKKSEIKQRINNY